jgi:hypothetical protein
LSSLWLNDRRRNVYSQNGEDGVLEAVFEKIGTRNRWCCELGAADGLEFSNTANLWRQQGGWNAVLIEADKGRYDKLVETLSGQPNVVGLHRYVSPRCPLNSVLQETGAPKDLDLVSIDVDGEDIRIWGDLSRYVPRVVVIEVDSLCAPGSGPSSRGMATLDEVVKLGWEKGYQLALHTGNAVFVRTEDAAALGVDPVNWQELFDRRWIS